MSIGMGLLSKATAGYVIDVDIKVILCVTSQ